MSEQNSETSRSEHDFRFDCKPDFAYLTVQVPSGQTLKVEASAMATMSTNMVMKTKMRGGLSRLVTGESIFINEFTADAGAGEIGIAPGSPGDMDHLYLDNQTVFLQNSAFVASSMSVDVTAKWQGFIKGFFAAAKKPLMKPCHLAVTSTLIDDATKAEFCRKTVWLSR